MSRHRSLECSVIACDAACSGFTPLAAAARPALAAAAFLAAFLPAFLPAIPIRSFKRATQGAGVSVMKPPDYRQRFLDRMALFFVADDGASK